MRIFGRACHRRYNEIYQYSVYFLRGNDPRPLNLSHQHEVFSLIQQNNLENSFLLYNSTEAKRKIEAWKKQLPWIRPHYAVKSNPCDQILEDLIQGGSGFDCASKTEMELALKNGASLQDIIYSNSIKNERDLQWAHHAGIQLTTADSIDELKKIKKYAPSMKVLWRIAIKQEIDDDLATPFSGKFGDDLETIEDIHERMNEIKELGIKLKGIHFHCGSGHHGSSGFGKAVKFARSCLQIGRKYNHDMNILDIGGGFPSGDLRPSTIQALESTRQDHLQYEVVAEPGRHFSGNSFYLLTRVLGKRVKNGKPCFHLNESLYHSFNCNLMDGVSFENKDSQFYSKMDERNEGTGIFERRNSTLFGMTCDGMDIIAKNLPIPVDMKVGDWLCFSGMGAYTHGCRSNFNGMTTTDQIIRCPIELAEPLGSPQPAYSHST